MRLIGFIPTHYHAKRYPGKPLIDIGGLPMIVRVYRQAEQAKSLSKCLVLTDDDRIISALEAHDVPYLRTSSRPRNGTERCAEGLGLLSESYDFVFNLQGDEPFIQPEQLESLANALRSETEIATLAKRIEDPEVLAQPATVKVVFDKQGQALYFSRYPIPYVIQPALSPTNRLREYPSYKHIGVYAYRSELLARLAAYEKVPLEQAESLEQLRWLAHGHRIQVVVTAIQSYTIDTPEDFARVQRLGLC